MGGVLTCSCCDTTSFRAAGGEAVYCPTCDTTVEYEWWRGSVPRVVNAERVRLQDGTVVPLVEPVDVSPGNVWIAVHKAAGYATIHPGG